MRGPLVEIPGLTEQPTSQKEEVQARGNRRVAQVALEAQVALAMPEAPVRAEQMRVVITVAPEAEEEEQPDQQL